MLQLICSECRKLIEFTDVRISKLAVETECCNGSPVDANGNDMIAEVVEAYDKDAMMDASEAEILRREDKRYR